MYNIPCPGGIAQLVRAFGSHPRGHRFEPYCLHQNEKDTVWCPFRFGATYRVRTYVKEYRPCPARRGRSAREIFFLNSCLREFWVRARSPIGRFRFSFLVATSSVTASPHHLPLKGKAICSLPLSHMFFLWLSFWQSFTIFQCHVQWHQAASRVGLQHQNLRTKRITAKPSDVRRLFCYSMIL